jgi:hypothetical protein
MYLTEILERCSEFEFRLGRLYRGIAKRFHNAADTRLWDELALECEAHADVLRREQADLDEQDESGPFLPEFAERLDRAKVLLADLEERARGLSTIDDAMALAVALEQATLEDLYDDLVVQGPPEFQLISERIEAALAAHPASAVPGVPRRRRSAAAKPKRD